MRYLGLILLLISNNLSAQNFIEDVKRMYRSYSEQGNLSFKVSMAVFDENEKPVELITGTIKKTDKFYRMKFGSREMVVGKKHVIMVDKEEKEILVFDSDKKYKPQVSLMTFPDSLEKYINGYVKYKGIIEGSKVYSIRSPNQFYSEMVISFDMKTGVISKIRYYFNQNEDDNYGAKFTEVKYTDIVIGGQLPSSYFSLAEFVQVKQGILIPAKGYEGFDIINQSKQNTYEILE